MFESILSLLPLPVFFALWFFIHGSLSCPLFSPVILTPIVLPLVFFFISGNLSPSLVSKTMMNAHDPLTILSYFEEQALTVPSRPVS